MKFLRRRSEVELAREDAALLVGLRAAQASEALPRVTWVLYLMLAAVAAALTWAAQTRVDEITKADARIVPDGKEQVIASLEGGILRELRVREGSQVNEGDELAQLDPTRAEAQQNESEARRLALSGTLARLQAESRGDPTPTFGKDVLAMPAIVQIETEAFLARRRGIQDAVATTQRSVELLMREVRMAESMAAKGLMSDVEVLRLRRQVNDLQMQSRERVNRFRQDASTELLRIQSELAQIEEQQVVRDDTLRRTVLKSPVKGLVKTIKVATVGGVVPPGGTLMEIVPIGPKVLVEARVKPADIGFVRVGQEAMVKLSAYEYTVYGGLKGKIVSISPDAIGDDDKSASVEGSYYRAVVRVDREGREGLKAKGKLLPVIPGMTGSVEVHTGERSVLSFLLRPMLKSREAFRER